MRRRATLGCLALGLAFSSSAAAAPSGPPSAPIRPPDISARASTLGDAAEMRLSSYHARRDGASIGVISFGRSERLAFASEEPIAVRLSDSATRATLRSIRGDGRGEVAERERLRPVAETGRRRFTGAFDRSLRGAERVVLTVAYDSGDRPRWGRGYRVTKAKFELRAVGAGTSAG